MVQHKRIRSKAGVSMVSVNPISVENGITGISGERAMTDTMSDIRPTIFLSHRQPHDFR
jgi:hypothetical protein